MNYGKQNMCAINHHESSGAMESAGAISIFCSSLSKFNLRYSHYIGDGDTKAYSKVREARPYGETLIPEKLECLVHVQKRLGTRLRNLRTIKKKKKLNDSKTLSGKGRLTDASINLMRNYFGMAISSE